MEQASTTRVHSTVLERTAGLDAEFQYERIAARNHDRNRPESPVSGVTRFDPFVARSNIVKREPTQGVRTGIAGRHEEVDPTARNWLPRAIIDHNARYEGSTGRSAPWLELKLSLSARG